MPKGRALTIMPATQPRISGLPAIRLNNVAMLRAPVPYQTIMITLMKLSGMMITAITRATRASPLGPDSFSAMASAMNAFHRDDV